MNAPSRAFFRLTARLFAIRAAWRGQVPVRVFVSGEPVTPSIPAAPGKPGFAISGSMPAGSAGRAAA